MTEVIRQLKWFSKHEGSDTVSLEIRTIVKVDGKVVADTMGNEYTSDKALLEAASGAPWDENTICSVCGLTRAEQVDA